MLVGVALIIELSAALFFNVFQERFTFFDVYLVKDEKLDFLNANFDSRLGWNRDFDTPYHERPRQKEYHRPLMATFGDSFTYCDQVQDDQTWQTYLAELLQADVYNLGSSGHGTDQVYLKFLSHYPQVNTPIVTLGLITENINRIVNVYRPFYFPKTLLWFTKPRFKLVDDQLVLLENPLKTKADLLKLKDLEFVTRLGAHDWWYARDNYPQLAFPYSRILLNRRMWLEAYYGKGDQRVDDMSPRPWENLWYHPQATALMHKIMQSFVAQVKQEYQALPIIMILPMKHEVNFYFEHKRLTHSISLILEHCRLNHYLCYEAISALGNSVSSKAEIDTLYQGHVSPKGNRIIARDLFEFLQEPLKTIGYDLNS